MSVKIYAAAKINLFLEVLGKIEDSYYHNVCSVMQSVELCDILNIDFNKKPNSVVLKGNRFESIVRKKNTSYRAATFFLEKLKHHPGITISCNKNIPVGTGLGGGSADAAATLLGLNKLFANTFSKQKLHEIAKKVGSDVPFCLEGGCYLVRGTGENLKKIDSEFRAFFVIVKPDYSTSTKKAYELLDKKRFKIRSFKSILKAIKSNNIKLVSTNLYNKFEHILINNKIKKIKKELKNFGAINSLMTGTGSAIYGLFDSEDRAIFAKNRLKKIYNEVFFVKNINYSNLIEF
ncbi:MAG: 4-(cytidine 5'-diphospho)-2-C-methyl-D-erythritol kinase [Oscillospiraceae bacterium]|jgi:4-diphosphocytidyl-2-C-methyl-D-erythritol kinase|nr:4-(cytidine 5'-diphospho)-2-C-methyl-D-erythritol kinase [Oscillospiraceae bacterium]